MTANSPKESPRGGSNSPGVLWQVRWEPVLGYVLPVHLLVWPLTTVQHPSLDLPGPLLVVLLSPRQGLILRSKGIACPCTGKLQLLVIPLGFTTAYRSDALFLFPGTHPFYSLNHFTHPSHLPLGHDFILFKQLHYCSIGALLFESKNVQLE